MAAAAERLGKPLMPWQRHVVDVALEVDPDTGRFAYDEVGLLVPRQSGKSTLILAMATHRCSAGRFFGGRQRVVYTAQTRNKAREKFEEDFAPDLLASRHFAPRATAHWGNGNEHIRFEGGSRFSIEASTEKAGHGGTLDLSFIDEAFAQVDTRLEQAFRPAMITRPNKQLWVVSTAGWIDSSPYLLDKSRAGRDQADMGVRSGLAFFEWSAPEDADPADEDRWWEFMPALGHTITIEAVRGEYQAAVRDGNLNGFRRAFMNQWVPKEDVTAETVVDVDVWASLEVADQAHPSPVAFAIEVAPSRKWANIAVAGRRADGSTLVQVIESGRGTGWVAGRVRQLVDQWRPSAVTLNPSGPAGSLIPALAQEGVELHTLAGREVSAACGHFVDAVEERSVRHLGQTHLNVALGAAKRRHVGDAYQFAPADKSVDIAPLWAVTLALFALERAEAKPRTKRSGMVAGIR